MFIEKESGTEIACLRTDRGGEFMSIEFKEFCDKVSIKRQLTTAFTPQQNGVAELRNRTIMNMVRCMLKESQVPSKMWSEAVAWATHILNRCPTSINPEKIPQELWSGSPPSVDHLKVFGSLCYAHVADQQRKKLDDKSVKCIFLGVSPEFKAYRLYNLQTKKIMVSRDVVFDESKGW